MTTYNFQQNVSSYKRFSFSLFPARNTTFCHGGRHGRHFEVRNCMTSIGLVEDWNRESQWSKNEIAEKDIHLVEVCAEQTLLRTRLDNAFTDAIPGVFRTRTSPKSTKL